MNRETEVPYWVLLQESDIATKFPDEEAAIEEAGRIAKRGLIGTVIIARAVARTQLVPGSPGHAYTEVMHE